MELEAPCLWIVVRLSERCNASVAIDDVVPECFKYIDASYFGLLSLLGMHTRSLGRL